MPKRATVLRSALKETPPSPYKPSSAYGPTIRLTLQPAVAKRDTSLWKYAGQALAISMKPCPASPNSVLQFAAQRAGDQVAHDDRVAEVRDARHGVWLLAVRFVSAHGKSRSAPARPDRPSGSGGSAASIAGRAHVARLLFASERALGGLQRG